VRIKMTFPVELKDSVAETLEDEKRIFDKGSKNPVMKLLDKTLKGVARVPQGVDMHAIDFGYTINSDTEAELVIVTPVDGMFKPEWIANKLKKEFEKADKRIKCELVKE